MRQALALLILAALARPLIAGEGPDEPRPTDAPARTDAPPPPATTAPLPSAAPVPASSTTGSEPMPMPVATSPAGGKQVEEIEPNPSKKLAFIFLGAAGGCFLLGGILGGVAKARADEQSGDPSNPPLYTSDLQGRAAEGKSLSTAAYTFFALGAALTIVDAVLWFEALRKPKVVRRTMATSTRLFPMGVRF